MKTIRKLSLFILSASFILSPILVLAQTSTTSSSDGGGAAAMGAFLTFTIVCCVLLFSLGYVAAKIYLTLDAVNRDYGDNNSPLLTGILLIWVLDMFIPLIGLILYTLIIMPKYPKKT